MSSKPIVNPSIPYIGHIGLALSPGKFVRILGSLLPNSKGFSINLQSGFNSFDDVALHLSVRVDEDKIIVNSQEHGIWSNELSYGNLQFIEGQQFEILIICEPTVFKIGINAQHLCEFPYRLPSYKISHIKIEGDVSISYLSVEAEPTAPSIDNHLAMNVPPPPYPAASGPPPLNSQQYVAPQQYTAPQQYIAPQPQYPLNSGPQTIIYPGQNIAPPGVYPSDPLIRQTPTIAALNSTPRSYQPPYWSQRFGYGNRKMMYIGLAIYGVFALIFITVFLVVFFTVFNKASKDFDEAKQRHEEFRQKHFSNW